MTTKKCKLDSISVEIYQYANGTLIHRYIRTKEGKSSSSESFNHETLTKVLLSIKPYNLEAAITSVTIYDHSNINYIE